MRRFTMTTTTSTVAFGLLVAMTLSLGTTAFSFGTPALSSNKIHTKSLDASHYSFSFRTKRLTDTTKSTKVWPLHVATFDTTSGNSLNSDSDYYRNDNNNAIVSDFESINKVNDDAFIIKQMNQVDASFLKSITPPPVQEFYNNQLNNFATKNFLSPINSLTSLALAATLGVLFWQFFSHNNMDLIYNIYPRGWTLKEYLMHVPLTLWQSYENVLEAHPLYTKAVTSATVYTIGDVIAQKSENSSTNNNSKNDNVSVFHVFNGIDYGRTLRSMLAGLIGHGPLSHYWYIACDNFFDNTLHLTQAAYWWSFIPKVAIDQSLWGPTWNACYMIMLGIMKLDNVKTIKSEVATKSLPLILAGLKLWVPAHFITYGLIPVENRLLWVDCVEILWVIVLASTAAASTTSPQLNSHDTTATTSTDAILSISDGNSSNIVPAMYNEKRM